MRIAVLNGEADTTGAATLSGPQAEPGTVHVISRVKVSATSTASGTAALYESDPTPSRYLDGSQTAIDDTWEGQLSLPGGQNLLIVFAGLDPGANVRARIYYVILGQAPDDTFSRMTR